MPWRWARMPAILSRLTARPRRALYLVFIVLSCLRMLVIYRHGPREWVRELLLRLGFALPTVPRTIWIHGEGLGEFNSATKLLQALRQACPDLRFVFTTSRTVTRHFLVAKYPHDLCLPHPWDLPFAIRSFFQRLNPRLLVLLEFHDGFCPGALLHAREAGIPVVVVNARSLHNPKPLRYQVADALSLVGMMAPAIDLFCAQNSTMRHRLERFGVPAARLRITGNMKYDYALATESDLAKELAGKSSRHTPCAVADGTRSVPATPDCLRGQLGIASATPVLVAGCIHPEEESLVLETFVRLRERHPELFLILAPQEPGRVSALDASLKERGMAFSRRSEGIVQPGSAGLLLDTFGELGSVYRLATLVLIGGSFTARGSGHSLVEAAACGKPIVFGPFMSSQQDMVATFLKDGAAVQSKAQDLCATLQQLLENAARREQIGYQARAVVLRNAGATERTFEALRPVLPGSETPSEHRPGTKWKQVVTALAHAPAGKLLLALRAQRIPDPDALRSRLGNPGSILCLGNGPSSEDPELGKLAHDCLFRVNWRWRERGFLVNPNVVFTGDHRAVRSCAACIFGFRTIAEETSVLLNTYFEPRLGRIAYFTAERFRLSFNEVRWRARPTNGAVMIALAAALQPARLIIAGIDLFQHPDGKYPGDGNSPNAYAAMHDREVELAIIRQALRDYRGELVLCGAVLKNALAGQRVRAA